MITINVIKGRHFLIFILIRSTKGVYNPFLERLLHNFVLILLKGNLNHIIKHRINQYHFLDKILSNNQ